MENYIVNVVELNDTQYDEICGLYDLEFTSLDEEKVYAIFTIDFNNIGLHDTQLPEKIYKFEKFLNDIIEEKDCKLNFHKENGEIKIQKCNSEVIFYTVGFNFQSIFVMTWNESLREAFRKIRTMFIAELMVKLN